MRDKVLIQMVAAFTVGLASVVNAQEFRSPLIVPMGYSASSESVTANGIYVIDAIHRNSIDKAILNSPLIDGVVLEVPWSTIEPREGKHLWSSIDSILTQAAAYSKKVSLVLGAGWQTPSWVYSDGVRQFKFIWDHSTWGPTLCSVTAIPLPWDITYLAKWSELVSAVGARYASDSRIASVKVTGINSKTEETFLPSSANQKISSGTTSCTSYDDVANWQASDYTRLKIEAAWQSVMQMFVQAFPDKKLEPMLVP